MSEKEISEERPDGYVIRAARAGDHAQVATLCARAWPHGEDYVPHAWDSWLGDQQQPLLVVERDGTVAAVAKVSFLAPHEAWLEGLRVDPAHRGRGLADWTTGICLGRARALGATVARFATGFNNVAVHKTAARYGLERVAAFTYFSAPPLAGAGEPCMLTEGGLPQVERLLGESATLAASHGLYETDWCWPEVTRERLAQAVRAGEVLGWRDAAGELQAVALARRSDSGELIVGLLAGRRAEVTALGLGLRGWASRRGASRVEAKLPALAPLHQAILDAGFEGEQDMEIWVFEKRWR